MWRSILAGGLAAASIFALQADPPGGPVSATPPSSAVAPNVVAPPGGGGGGAWHTWYTNPSSGTPDGVWHDHNSVALYQAARTTTINNTRALAYVKVAGVGTSSSSYRVSISFSYRATKPASCKWEAGLPTGGLGALKCELQD